MPELYVLLLAKRQRGILDAWTELAPHLGRAALLALGFSVIVALVMARLILRPIQSLTRATEAIAHGNYAQRIEYTGHDEVGRLAAAFNYMAQQVARSQQLLRDFLANVSHELKTPLTSIQGFSQAMLDGALQSREEFASGAQIINGEAARMRRLVDDLLFLSKVESGQIPMHRRPLDLGPFLERCVQRLRWQADQCEVQIACEACAEPSLPAVEADPDRLEQAVVNLLENAVRHAAPSSVVTVRARATMALEEASLRVGPRLHSPQPAVAISVQNYGDAIPPDDLPRIFERFYQVEKSRVRRSDGSGLGLAIVREIVQAHGGTVQATSGAEHGTELTIVLPAGVARAPQPVAVTEQS
jgi:signal transduction histidine kinase